MLTIKPPVWLLHEWNSTMLDTLALYKHFFLNISYTFYSHIRTLNFLTKTISVNFSINLIINLFKQFSRGLLRLSIQMKYYCILPPPIRVNLHNLCPGKEENPFSVWKIIYRFTYQFLE